MLAASSPTLAATGSAAGEVLNPAAPPGPAPPLPASLAPPVRSLDLAALGLASGDVLGALSQVPSFTVAAFAMFGVGLGFGGFMTLNGAVIVRSTEPLYFGRVMSLTMLAFGCFGLMACEDVCPKELPLLEVNAYLRRKAFTSASTDGN